MGFMGSGKTTLGKQVAAILDHTFIDLDRFIETEENRTITDIFTKDGESAFRKIEFNALARILMHPKQVIAVGGGAPCQPGNLEVIRDFSFSIYLKVSQSELFNRLARSTTSRPLLSGKTENDIRNTIDNLLLKRESYYMQADRIIESDSITPELIIFQIPHNKEQSL